jgi:hypothetical protein
MSWRIDFTRRAPNESKTLSLPMCFHLHRSGCLAPLIGYKKIGAQGAARHRRNDKLLLDSSAAVRYTRAFLPADSSMIGPTADRPYLQIAKYDNA